MARLIHRFRLWWAVRVAMAEARRIERMQQAYRLLGVELARLSGEPEPTYGAPGQHPDAWGDFERNDREAFIAALQARQEADDLQHELDGYDD